MTIDQPRIAGLIFDSSMHYLDHLAPFCALLGYPLFVTDGEIYEMAVRYYPQLIVHEISLLSVNRHIKEFTHLITCAPRPLLHAAVGPFVQKSLWLPHGYSDKGGASFFHEALRHDKYALVYGKTMKCLLQKENNLQTLSVGHFRNIYYQKNRAFYDAMTFCRFDLSQQTILFAPTWDDFEGPSSLWRALPSLIQHLPRQYNLFVKVHPNTLRMHAAKIEQLIGRFESGQVQFVHHLPTILPLLNRSDFYLGDRSSIGYDYLLFNRPLFFLEDQLGDLGRSGQTITPESFFNELQKTSSSQFARERVKLYQKTFDSISAEDLQKNILTLLDATV